MIIILRFLIQSLRAFRRTHFNAWRFAGEGMKELGEKQILKEFGCPKMPKE